VGAGTLGTSARSAEGRPKVPEKPGNGWPCLGAGGYGLKRAQVLAAGVIGVDPT